MAKKRIYKHHQRATEASLESDLLNREQGYAEDTKRSVGKLEDGTVVREGGSSVRYLERYASLAAAAAIFGSDSIELVVATEASVPATLDFATLCPNTSIRVLQGGSFNIASGQVLTISKLEAGDYRIVYGAGQLLFNGPGDSRIAWWYDGSDYGPAINSALACRGDYGNDIYMPVEREMFASTQIVIANSHIRWTMYGGQSINDDSIQRIIWSGAAGATVVSSTAGVVGCEIEIAIDGAHITKWGFVGDGMRKCQISLTVMRCVGFWYITNCYYSSFGWMNARLQTPGTYIGGAGQVSLADWQAVCNSGFAAPCTWRSNANNMRIEKLALSKVGAYEIPATASAIFQMVLLSGQDILTSLPTYESVNANTIPTGAEDGDKFGFSTGIFGDTGNQLSFPVFSGVSASNTDNHLMYVSLSDVAGVRTIDIYSDSARTALVATGSRTGDGIVILHEQNGSGLKGQWTVTYTADNAGITYRENYNTAITNQLIKVESGTAIGFDYIYIEKVFVTKLLDVASVMRGGLYIGEIYAEDCDVSGSLISSSSLKDIEIGAIGGIGVTFNGPYVSDGSNSTRIRVGSIECHNRYVLDGGVNYSEEMLGYLGLVSTSGPLDIILQPYVVAGLVASASSDSISDYIQITPGSIRDGSGRSITVGRYETVNGVSAYTGWRFRPGPVAASWNVCVDAAGCVFIENQASLKATAEQGKIVIATYTTNGSGVVSGFSAIASPKCLRGVLTPLGGGLTSPGNFSVNGKAQIGATLGNMGIGDSASSDIGLYVAEALTGLTGVTQRGALIRPRLTATTKGAAGEFQLRTSPTAFTMTTGIGVSIADANKGASSTITTQIGLNIDNQTQGATNRSIKTGTGIAEFGDNILIPTVGKGLQIKAGTNGRINMGNVLVAGTVTVANTSVTANTMISWNRVVSDGTLGHITITRNAGVGYTITSSSATETSTIDVMLTEAV